MAYRDRDPLETVAEQPPPKASADKNPSFLRSLRRAVRDAIMRQVSTKR
jgi:hypothetical protein